ncbi:hypothetical protein [Planobispora rosea]|uniref:hypothetical protein n=1 Tax=Planobispora rosea TaxID=35762 RepID=UPI00083A7CAA|nr:hypothetical protein [Planobispora rosea]
MPQGIATRNCQPWCTDHVDATPAGRPTDPDDQLCVTRVPGTYGEVTLTHSATEGPAILLYRLRDELTPVEARDLVDRLNRLLNSTCTTGAHA